MAVKVITDEELKVVGEALSRARDEITAVENDVCIASDVECYLGDALIIIEALIEHKGEEDANT